MTPYPLMLSSRTFAMSGLLPTPGCPRRARVCARAAGVAFREGPAPAILAAPWLHRGVQSESCRKLSPLGTRGMIKCQRPTL